MRKLLPLSVVAIALGTPLPAAAVDGGPFPLPASTGVLTPDDPFLLSSGLTSTLITDRDTLNAQGLPSTFANWDMSAFDRSSHWIYVPAEVGTGAGVFRYDVKKGTFKVLMEGNSSGIRTADPAAFDGTDDDFARFDPATATPFGSLLLGEETTGGRLFEVRNPKPNGKNIHADFLGKVPSVAHEGLRFDSQGNLYFVDEFNSGSVYKFVPRSHGNLKVGQSFVLVVDDYDGRFSGEDYNSANNLGEPRTGLAHWEPLTDEVGIALPGVSDPFAFVTTTGGRNAADSVGGTPYGRPEDITLNTLASGNEIVYFSATSEDVVYGIELIDDTAAMVRIFVDRNTIDLATTATVGTEFNNPDNLATGADGTIYVVEDQEVPVADIWKAIDADNDGVAEAIGRWLSLGIPGAEPTGLEQDPKDPNRFILTIQHPDTGNDALWEIRLH
jgi:hypothetical protein